MSNITFEDVVSQVKDKLDILDVVSQDVILKKSGTNYWGLCPFHKEKTPSFSVNPAKGIYKCFGCGEGGDVLSYLMKTRGVEFKDLIKDLAEEFGIELPNTYSKGPNKDSKAQMIKACTLAAEFYQNELFSSSGGAKGLKYLNGREIDEKIIKTYGLGFAPDSYDKLYLKLKQTFSDEILEKAGLILQSSRGGFIDRFRNRITIPIKNENGEVVAFGARAVDEGQNPKYLNSSDSPIYNKSKLLYGLYYAKDAIKERDSIIIMEGYFDVISSQAHGIGNCVASCGTSLTTEHVKLISRYCKSRKIYLAFDTDMAGIKATKRGAEIIKEAFVGLGNVKQFDESYTASTDDKYACEIRVITPPEGKDPDEFVRKSGAKAYFERVEHAPLLVDFEINQILKGKNEADTPVKKANLIKELIPVLSDIQNQIIRAEYVKMVASTLNIDERAINAELKNINNDGHVFSVNVNTFVTNSSNILEKAQKNLLSLYLVNDKQFSFAQISEMIKYAEFSNKKLIIVKNTIDKLTCTVNNVKAVIEELFTEFAQDEELKAHTTDLICTAEPFQNLSPQDFQAVIDENIKKISQCRRRTEQLEIQSQYKGVNDDDNEALKIQMKLRDKINNRRKSEIINDEEKTTK